MCNKKFTPSEPLETLAKLEQQCQTHAEKYADTSWSDPVSVDIKLTLLTELAAARGRVNGAKLMMEIT